jgi:hypothetical protein
VLELAFATKELRSLCEDAACAYEAYGPIVADALVGRLADLRAASHPLELPFAESHPATEDDPEHVVITLAEGRFLVIAANHGKLPRAANGLVAWEHVSRVIVLRLE